MKTIKNLNKSKYEDIHLVILLLIFVNMKLYINKKDIKSERLRCKNINSSQFYELFSCGPWKKLGLS